MSLPTGFEGSSIELAPVASQAARLDVLGLGISTVVALVFVSYLLRCYCQEFWHARRVRYLKRRSRLKPFPRETAREAVAEGCRSRRNSVMIRDVANAPPSLDWRGLASLVPLHDRITLVWDNGRANDGALPRLHVATEPAHPQTLAARIRHEQKDG